MRESIDFIDWWLNRNNLNTDVKLGWDSSRSAIKLVLPANKRFQINTAGGGAGLQLRGPITIEGEDRDTSRLRLSDSTTSTQDLIKVANQNRITFRNFTMEGSYDGSLGSDGLGQLVKFDTVDGVLLENMTFTHNRAVIIGGDWVRNLVMRGCLLSESRNGGMVISNVENITVVDNDFRWVPDDPVALTISDLLATAPYRNDGGAIQVIGNRMFGTRGININGAKNVIVADNTHTLGRGRAIHIGTTTFQSKGDTSTLNIIVRNNIITDLLDARVDPRFDPNDDRAGGGHRAIDIEMLFAAPGGANANIPGLAGNGNPVLDPTAYYYAYDHGAQGARVWKPTLAYAAGSQGWWDGRIFTTTLGGTTGTTPPTGTGLDGSVTWNSVARQKPTPHSGNILIEGNVISRSRPPAQKYLPPPAAPNTPDPDYIAPFDDFRNYNVGLYGGDVVGYPGPGGPAVPTVSLDYITPREGIALTGAVRNLVIRGNQIRNCDVGISLEGDKTTLPFSLLDVVIEDNDLFDWKTAGVLIFDYAPYPPLTTVPPQRVSVLNNRADGDPFQRNLARTTNGKWADTTVDVVVGSTTLAAGYGSFIDVKGISHLVIAGNHVRNVSQLVAGLDTTTYTMQTIRDNVAYCDYSGLKYQPGNAGIGNVIRPELGWRYISEGSNPAAANYGLVLNSCPLAVEQDGTGAPTLPTTGKWVEGTIVANLKPDAFTSGTYNGYRIWAWRRMTTSSGNVVPTNWLPLTTKG